LADNPDARAEVLPEIRERSRQEYLKKREEQQLMLLKRQLEEEKLLFRNETLTLQEQQDIAYRERLIELAEERRRMDAQAHVEGYHMPESYIQEKGKLDRKKLESALYGRYEDDPEGFLNEQEEWEQFQIKKANLLDQEGKSKDASQYDFVFDEEQQIEFVMKSTLNRSESREVKINLKEAKGTFKLL
jgi:pre-mRNA-splicing factor ATP-dependent RNA helicase DHX16